MTLNGAHNPVGKPSLRLPIQCHPNGEAAIVLSNDLDATYGFASGPLSYGIEAFFAQRSIVETGGYWWFCHALALTQLAGSRRA